MTPGITNTGIVRVLKTRPKILPLLTPSSMLYDKWVESIQDEKAELR